MRAAHILGIILFFVFVQPVRASIVLNEFLPNPLGSDDAEWIELYNSGTSLQDLSNWKLDDVDGGGTSPYTIASGTAIASEGFLVFDKSKTNIGLNNDGDTVRLVNSLGAVVDSYTYTSTSDDISFGRSDDGGGSWMTCKGMTKGSSNNCPLPTPIPTATPVPTPTVTPTSTPSPTLAPTVTLTPSPTPKLSATPESIIAILGESTESTPSRDATGTAVSDGNNMRPLAVSLLFIGSGAALLSAVLAWQKKSVWTKVLKQTTES